MWSGPKGSSVEDQITRAQDAKKGAAGAVRSAPKPGDEAYEEQQAKLKAIADARREREEQRERARVAEAARIARKPA